MRRNPWGAGYSLGAREISLFLAKILPSTFHYLSKKKTKIIVEPAFHKQ